MWMLAADLPEVRGTPLVAWFLIDIAIIVVVARLVGRLFVRFRQPAVVGEILAGIMLGPAVLGLLPGDIPDFLFPDAVRPYLTVVAELGLVVFMFLVGLELDMGLIRGKERIASVISASSVALPLLLGIGLAAVLWPMYETAVIAEGVKKGNEIDFPRFALFIGAAMSVTAFPVLARILSERRMQKTAVGALTLACAAVDDVLAWSLLAFVLALVKSGGGSPTQILVVLGWSVLFISVMFLVVRPQLVRLTAAYASAGKMTAGVFSVVMAGMLASAAITSLIGIHAIFGAFLFGVIMPRREAVALNHDLFERLEGISVLLLLPVFFIVAGLEVDFEGLGIGGLGQLAAIMAVAVGGKFIGAAVAGRAQGLGSRQAAAIGVLMNTRGLTEIVILTIGLSAGVLTRELFSLMVVMAILTTVMTEPLLRRIYSDRMLERDIAEAERASLGDAETRILGWVGQPDLAAAPSSEALLRVGSALTASTDDAQLVLVAAVPSLPSLELASGLGGELALMTEAIEEMGSLSRAATARGARATVRTRMSDDPLDELTSDVASLQPELVVTLRHEPRLNPLERLDDLDVDLAVVAPGGNPATGVVVARTDGGPHDGAVVEVAARLAYSERRPLVLTRSGTDRAPRELQRVAERLTVAGLTASAGDPTGGPEAGVAVVVSPLGEDEASPADAGRSDAGRSDGPLTIAVHARSSMGREGPMDRIDQLALDGPRLSATSPSTTEERP